MVEPTRLSIFAISRHKVILQLENTEHSKHNFIDGGQHVVKDLVLTMNQAMGPVQERVTMIHDTYGKEETKVTVESSVEKKDFMSEAVWF